MVDELTQQILDYLKNTPEKIKGAYWDDIKYLNDYGPDALEYADEELAEFSFIFQKSEEEDHPYSPHDNHLALAA